jgi:hypothetical protein
MNSIPSLTIAILLSVTAAARATDTDPIAKYLVDASPGVVSAGELLGLNSSAVSTIQSPRDFVAALNGLSSNSGKNGFGLSFTPARTAFAPVSIQDYSAKSTSRLWAGTTFSYAQSVLPKDGLDYKQSAYALNVSHYINKEDDPAVAGYVAFSNCPGLNTVIANEAIRRNAISVKLDKQGVSAADLNARTDELLLKDKSFYEAAHPAYKGCVVAAVDRAKAKWNASQIALTLGQGYIVSPASGAARLSLGRSIFIAGVMAPNAHSAINLTLRRTGNAVDLTTVSGTPSFKSSTLIAARWTYRPVDIQDMFALAEVSNANASTMSISQNVFKAALGIDKRLAEGLWIELRVGRNRTLDGASEQTTALMGLKLSPSSTLLAK